MASLWLFPPRRRPRSGRAGRRALLCCGAPGTPWEAPLESLPGPGVAVYLLYRDNPQDEAWLARSAGAAGKALAQGLGSLDG